MDSQGLKVISSLYCTLSIVCLCFCFVLCKTSQIVNVWQLYLNGVNLKFQNNSHYGYQLYALFFLVSLVETNAT